MADRTVSIRRRVLVAATLLLLLAALVLVAFIRDYAERASERAFDSLLGASALIIAGAVQLEEGEVTVELPLASFSMFSGRDRIFYAVEAPDGTNVTGYPDLSEGLVPEDDSEPTFADAVYRGEPVRVASAGRLVSTASGTGWATVRVAETLSERRALAREIFQNALLPVVALLLLALVILWFGIGRAFRPLLSLERHLRARAPENLSPVDLPVPQEAVQLVGALNDFMGRLALARERLEALVAEAAHEVRTPLASLRLQAEVARGESDPEALRTQVARIHDEAVQASQLVSQLLMDATISHRLDTAPAGATPVGAVVTEVVRRLDPDTADRVRVSIAPGMAEASLGADRVVLREMLRNLVDNALTYSRGPVEIAVAARADGSIGIDVADRGPGIAIDEREAVFQRFRRGGASAGTNGSGLGLAIVRRAVEAQRGRIDLKDRPGGGLLVRLVLPRVDLRTGRPAARALASLALLAILWWPIATAGAAEVVYPAPDGSGETRLQILGATDTGLFAHLVRGFQARRPDVTVTYEEGETLAIFEAFASGARPPPDVMISSASDLQVKLVNDGFAQPLNLAGAANLPGWAQWRSELFGFSFEPAVIVYNPDILAENEVPRSHLDLAELLEKQAVRLAGKIATYDVARSGVGYMLAAQDQSVSSYFWRLASAFGRAGVRLSGASPAILDGVERGDLALGYNVLGSYAFARQAAGARIGIVVPDDYVLVVTRSMFVPVGAQRADLGEAFIEFALSDEGQSILAGPAALGAVVPGTQGSWTAERIAARGRGAVQPVPLGPSLLVGLDRQRRARFLDTWMEIVAPQ
ncbi:extracellular solute-binding protein [Aureimonas sp. Leaf324]|uniref:sensor histidine kinase n=1 Tax=Aureimonas sp. Leaf324 TaxID=1736336 RepID=UPI0006F1CC32|nr:extracellular solute-binding protein [Aureimonas sp. Leaf324]KQQ81313.1 iron-binding protein [Aureimonas sp. Leaf324]